MANVERILDGVRAERDEARRVAESWRGSCDQANDAALAIDKALTAAKLECSQRRHERDDARMLADQRERRYGKVREELAWAREQWTEACKTAQAAEETARKTADSVTCLTDDFAGKVANKVVNVAMLHGKPYGFATKIDAEWLCTADDNAATAVVCCQETPTEAKHGCQDKALRDVAAAKMPEPPTIDIGDVLNVVGIASVHEWQTKKTVSHVTVEVRHDYKANPRALVNRAIGDAIAREWAKAWEAAR